jgi:aminoglycoside 3-N-acetyltransferase I
MKIETGKIEIKRLAPDELKNFKALISVFHEVFEMEDSEGPDENYLQHLLDNTDFIAFVIGHNGRIIGGATAYALPGYYSQSTELFIYDVAILPDYQRSGLGAKLIAALKDFCKQNGLGEMFVPAHEEDTHALKFYKATGGKAEKVIHFNYSIKQ